MTKRIIICFVFLISELITTAYSQTVWVPQYSGTSNVFRYVQFLDSQTGWAAGWYGTAVKTTNGGTNWTMMNTNTSNSFTSVFFVNSMTGWLSGGSMTYGTGYIQKTTDGGSNWFNVHSSNLGLVFRTVFLTPSTGYSVTSMGFIMKSTDGGYGWSILYTNSNYVFTNCFFYDSNAGWVIGDNGVILNTTNGGNSFVTQSSGTNSNLEGIHFISAATGFISSNYGNLLKTTNGGVNWVNKLTGSYLWLNSVYFANANIGWLTGGDAMFNQDKEKRTVSQILKSTDGGESWTQQTSPSSYFLCSVTFANSQTGWAVGSNGLIFKTTNGGVTFIQNVSTTIPTAYNLHQNYPNPFNPETQIRFDVPKSSEIRLSVYDMNGKLVEDLFSSALPAGTFTFKWNASKYSSGVYYVRMESKDFSSVKKMTFIK